MKEDNGVQLNTEEDSFFKSSSPNVEPAKTPSTPLVTATQSLGLQEEANKQPTAVVNAFSVRGVEYTMMLLPLWLVAGSLIWILLSIINDSASFELLALPAALLAVCFPVFAILFLRLRRAELSDPKLRFDPSKRRLTQFTQIVAFAACLFNVIAFVYLIMQKISGNYSTSLVKPFLSMLTVLVIAGGILAYYWVDEHRNFK